MNITGVLYYMAKLKNTNILINPHNLRHYLSTFKLKKIINNIYFLI